MHQNRFRFLARADGPGLHWGSYDAPPDMRLGRRISPYHSPSLSVFGVSMCGPVFSNMITGNPTVITSARRNLCVFCFCRDDLNGLLLEGAYRQCFVQQEDGIVDEQVDKTQKQRSFSVVDMLLSIRCQRLYIIYTYTDQRPRDASNTVSLSHRGILFWTAAVFTTERQCSRDADSFQA